MEIAFSIYPSVSLAVAESLHVRRRTGDLSGATLGLTIAERENDHSAVNSLPSTCPMAHLADVKT